MNIRTLSIGLAALMIAGCSAYFSIIGLSTLFAGSSLTIMVMAGSMEFSKLVTASFLYMYWKRLGTVMKTYMTTALVVLVFITSMGIYGYLTDAFQATSQELEMLGRQVEMIEERQTRYQEQISSLRSDRESMNESVTQLTEGLSTGNVIQYIDPESGQLVTTTSGATREVLRDNLERVQNERDRISNRITTYTDSINVLDRRIMELRNESDLTAELGPLQFIADVGDWEMSTVVNVIALLIMFSFDPLAISLVIAFNMSLYFNNKDKFDKVLVDDDEPDDDDPLPPTTPDFDSLQDEVEHYREKNETPPSYKSTVDIDESKSNSNLDYEELGEDIDEFIDDVEDEDVTDWITDRLSEEELRQRYEIISDNIKSDDTHDIYGEKDSPTKIDDDPERVEPIEDEDTVDLSKLKITRPAVVKYTPNGKQVGYDTSGDGLVDKWKHSTYYRAYTNQKPYYAKPNFNWNNTESWVNDEAAVNYWITNVKNPSNYPTDFSSKTY